MTAFRATRINFLHFRNTSAILLFARSRGAYSQGAWMEPKLELIYNDLFF